MSTTHAPVSAPLVAAAPTVERRLKFAGAFTALSGVFFMFGTHDAVDVVVRRVFAAIFLRPGDPVVALSDEAHLSYAIGGGMLVGLGVLVWMLADRLLDIAPDEVRRVVFVGVSAWFLFDSAGSIAAGAWLNVVLNLGYLALFLLPLRTID